MQASDNSTTTGSGSQPITIDPSRAPARVKNWLQEVRPAIDAAIDARLPPPTEDAGRLVEAMRYAALGPGKRLRPALAVAACEAAGGSRADALAAAAAVEMLHAYTLVHDDLPAMDDDDERRGRATVHVAFGEDIAILAGDGLLTAAFAAVAELGQHAAAAVTILARRAGHDELLDGQARDLAQSADAAQSMQHNQPGLDQLEQVHARKTGALFAAAAELGAIAAGANATTRDTLARYGMAIGIAFQHADDLDDGEFAHLSEQAQARRVELAAEAEHLARSLYSLQKATATAVPLVDLAQWIGNS